MPDPLVQAARRLAAALTVFDIGLGLVAIRRPAAIRRLFATDGGDEFYARWGITILGYSAVQAVTAVRPTPGTLSASAALRAIEIPADYYASRSVPGRGRVLLPMASAFNVAATAIFLAAARRARSRT